ncbi:hypothetical protein PCASD_11632 [Puccinia coronata f. sp. avenae]|uniref:Uncharacterized protein n=1 Tax=Puccinia coronata f. sp. avenae TaxID=200324 RepID=A0A2N5TAB0_9BASI|nr:hypothetical protein PCASD_11632 [Puccinia coronata f. sp. avenae]
MSEITKLKDKLTKLSIPKLDESNYLLWSSHMRAYLQSKDLWKYVSGNAPTIAKKKKLEAANILISHLGKVTFDVIITIANEDKPQVIWAAIVKRFASKSINNKAKIWLKFMQYKYNGDLPKYLKDCHKMIKEILVVQLGMQDDVISMSILAKLSKDYWKVVDNIIMNESIIFFPSP